MTVNDITTFSGTFLHPDDGRRYSYDASYNAHPPVAWRADLHDAAGWSRRLAGALIDDGLCGPQLRATVNAAIADEIRAALIERSAGHSAFATPGASSFGRSSA